MYNSRSEAARSATQTIAAVSNKLTAFALPSAGSFYSSYITLGGKTLLFSILISELKNNLR